MPAPTDSGHPGKSELTSCSSLTDLHIVRCVPDSWVTHLDLLPIVRPELVAMQLFGGNRPATAERWVDPLWSYRLLSGPSILRFLDEHGARGSNGNRGATGVRRGNEVPTTSRPRVESRPVSCSSCVRSASACAARSDSGGIEWTGRV